MAYRLKIVGLLRFSVLTPTYYSERFATLEETAAHLFSEERMELRFRLFEKLCLPSLVRQTDSDFAMVVLTAESLPEKWLERLLDLIEPLPNMQCVPVGTGRHYKLLQHGYNTVPTNGVTHRVMFRLDDDDALDMNFIKRTRKSARALLELNGPETPFIMAHNRGFYVRSQPGENEVFDACERAPLSTATTLVAPVGHPQNPYRYNHRNFAQHFNTYSDISVPGFVRTIHGDNKSNPSQQGQTHRMKEREIARQLRRYFDMDINDLKAL